MLESPDMNFKIVMINMYRKTGNSMQNISRELESLKQNLMEG